MKLFKIETGNFKLDGGALFGVVPKSIWQKIYPADENNLCNICMRCLLIEVENRLILIDCGMGNTMPESLLKYYFTNGSDSLINSLAQNGFTPNDITDVVFSHLHFDHCGGAITKMGENNFELTFKNAQYWIGKSHWESALQPNRREKASFLSQNINPLQASNKLTLIDTDTEIAPGVNLTLYNGHTKGQIVPIITYNDKVIAFCADLIPTAAHIPISFVCGYDINPVITMLETESFLQTALENNYTLFFEHDLQIECCDLQQTNKGVAIKNTYTLNDFTKKNY